MKFPFILIISILLFSSGVHADIYKCENENGHISYSENRCETGSKEYEIKQQVKQQPKEQTDSDNKPDSMKEFKESKKRSKIRSLDLKIKKLQEEIDSIAKKRDEELIPYRKKIDRNIEKAGKNTKKAAIRNKELNEQVEAVEKKYVRKLEQKKSEISKLQQQKSDLE